jgi:ubiquinone/menaquinone biosynthesis C-methylase UbiE
MNSEKRAQKLEKLARIYDDEILPIWASRFGRMMLRGLEVPPKATVLDVACGTGYPGLELLRKMDEQSRVIAIDSSSAMLDVARKKAGDLSGKRVFFRTESALPKLPFTADVYDVVMCNLGIHEMPNPKAALRDFARVTKPGGRVIVTLPLDGTWSEFYDIYREVLVKHDKNEMIERLDRLIATMPDAAQAESWLMGAGLADTKVDVEEFSLLFRSAREFFFAPVVEYGPLSRWKEIAGRGQELQDVFWYIKQAIDAYFGTRAFEITVVAGCLSGKKQLAEENETARVGLIDPEELNAIGAASPSASWSSAPPNEDVVDINTGDVELVEDDVELDAFKDDEEPPPDLD